MADIIQFVPKHELASSENLKEFIRLCKHDLEVFGNNLNWNSYYWPEAGITFGNINNTKGVHDKVNIISEPLCEFAKAYVRYKAGTKIKNSLIMRGFKCIEQALMQLFERADIADVNIAVLDLAADIAKKRFIENPKSPYQAGCQIQNIASFVTENRLVANNLSGWEHGIKNASGTPRTGQQAQAEREKKLPDLEAIHAVAEVFASNPTSPRDIFTSSIVAMLLCAPSRISEILSLPVDCEYFDQTGKKTKHMVGDSFRAKTGNR